MVNSFSVKIQTKSKVFHLQLYALKNTNNKSIMTLYLLGKKKKNQHDATIYFTEFLGSLNES